MSKSLLPALLLVVGCDGIFSAPRTPTGSTTVASVAAATTPIALHRLTNDEYTNTVQDLLLTTTRPGDGFPKASVGESGFKNDSTALAVNEDWVTRAYSAADALANELIASKGTAGGAYAQLLTCPAGTSGEACAGAVLATLASRAYRRPVTTDSVEHAQLMAAFRKGMSFDEGLHDAVVAMLMSPSFLFIATDAPTGDQPLVLDGYTVATRLSYFLWQTAPDDELYRAARDGELTTDAGLDAQVRRMLQDPRAKRLGRTLVREWAGLANLESSSIEGLSDALRLAMVQETDLFMQELMQNDRSLLDVVNGGYSYVNKPLADLYGVPFPGTDPAAFVRVELDGAHRKGIGTQASVLAVTAGAIEVTHPVRRGFWVAQRVMCQPPPPPPMDVPPLQPPTATTSIKERLKEHESSPACSGCHVVMDAVGLGLENYDSLGRWRETYVAGGPAIDASGTLPDGTEFLTPDDLYAALAEQSSVRACLARQVMSLAFTRAVKGPADAALARKIGQQHLTPTGTFSGLIAEIVKSPQFRQQARAEAR